MTSEYEMDHIRRLPSVIEDFIDFAQSNAAGKPTRVSSVVGDPGYMKWTGGVEIHLDGKRVELVLTADEVAGTVLRYTGERNGHEWLTETLQGKVEIKWPA